MATVHKAPAVLIYYNSVFTWPILPQLNLITFCLKMCNDEDSELLNGLLPSSNSICMSMGKSLHIGSLAIEALNNLDYDLHTTGCLEYC